MTLKQDMKVYYETFPESLKYCDWCGKSFRTVAALRARVAELERDERCACTWDDEGDVTGLCSAHQGYFADRTEDEIESMLRQFAGWLSGDIPELHKVEVPRLAESLLRFLDAKRKSASAGASNTPVPDQFLPFRVEEQTGAYPHQNEWEVWTAGDDDTAFQVAVCNSQLMAEAIAHYGRELLQRAHPRQLSVQPSKGDE